MNQPYRLTGGQVDRSRLLNFHFNGRAFTGYGGDSLASALLANGVRFVARSFKYHRPRGIVGLGAEDPSALLLVESSSGSMPNTRATQAWLQDGMIVRPQNCWPSLRFDLGAVNSLVGRFIPAGFYYKTFMGPGRAWKFYEPLIRGMAGLGSVPDSEPVSRYDQRYAHTDLLVVGGGPAGIMAALAAARTGARVMLVDDGPEFGGRLLFDEEQVDSMAGHDWVKAAVSELAALPGVRLLARSTVAGRYDHGLTLIIEQSRSLDQTCVDVERVWKVRAGRTLYCTGAVERPLVFPGNDRPGVMLASAAVGYATYFAVACGRRAVVVTNNDSGYASAVSLHRSGVRVAAIVDCRPGPRNALLALAARGCGIEVLTGSVVESTVGRTSVAGVIVASVGAQASQGRARRISCDLVSMAGGWTPSVQLQAQEGGSNRYDADLGAFVPDIHGQGSDSAGACAGSLALSECLEQGDRVARRLIAELGFVASGVPVQRLVAATVDGRVSAGLMPVASKQAKAFVDFQNDVTAADIRLATRENYISVEHLKRYTTLGMGTDQGKLGNVNGMGLLAAGLNRPPEGVGTTKFRPPYIPVAFGAMAARHAGEYGRPRRRGAIDAWQDAHGAVRVNTATWCRAQYFPLADETPMVAINREVSQVRSAAGLCDVSSMGKIEVFGPQAGAFLDRLCINRIGDIDVGEASYWMMLRDDGVPLDDGYVCRLANDHFFMAVSTQHIDAVLDRMEFQLQAAAPSLEAVIVPVTDQWFSMAIAGPRSRELIESMGCSINLATESMPHMSVREGVIGAFEVRLVRYSFSGELAYEAYVRRRDAQIFWDKVALAGMAVGAVPYGTEAMGVMRIEKGHILMGREADGRVLPSDLGLAHLIDGTKSALGQRSLDLECHQGAGRRQLVGILARDKLSPLPTGGHIVREQAEDSAPLTEGVLTSTAFSPTLNQYVGLALVVDGRSRLGEEVRLLSPLRGLEVAARIVDHVFVDPEESRYQL